jgi:hypothetical protein
MVTIRQCRRSAAETCAATRNWTLMGTRVRGRVSGNHDWTGRISLRICGSPFRTEIRSQGRREEGHGHTFSVEVRCFLH